MALCWDSCTVVKARCAFNEPMFVFSTSIVLSLLILARSCCLSAEAYYYFCCFLLDCNSSWSLIVLLAFINDSSLQSFTIFLNFLPTPLNPYL